MHRHNPFSRTLFLVAAAVGCGLLAQAPPTGGSKQDEGLDVFLELLTTPVEAATKQTQKLSEAPAVISVVSSDAIRSSGARSVGEALNNVPGLYGIYDFLSTNLGVRGVNGGPRAYGRIVKVMINGQPIAFRSDGTNFLGPELIPIDVVERIEVVRGPASALYGANAFLGVINIVTYSDNISVAALRYSQFSSESTGFGHSEVLGGKTDRWGGVIAVSTDDMDRSGYELPRSSPKLLREIRTNRTSQKDVSRPQSVYGQGWFKPSDTFRLELSFQQSSLDSKAEWLDFGTLSHENRVALNFGFVRLKADWIVNNLLTLTGAMATSKGNPSNLEHLIENTSTSTYPERDFQYKAVDSMIEAKFKTGERDALIVGLDNTVDSEQLMNVYTVNIATGIRTLSNVSGQKQPGMTFTNQGAYAQYCFYPLDKLGVTANYRYDKHNLYGSNSNYRLGLVYAFTPKVSGKLLYGTSFKAPSPLQMYGQPLYTGEVLGNPNLKPETAKTTEAEIRWQVSDHIGTSVNVFRNKINDKVELVPGNGMAKPMNQGTLSTNGMEAEANAIYGAHKLRVTVAYQKTDSTSYDPFLGELVSPSTMYPQMIAFASWQVRTTWGTLEVNDRYVGDRRASNSNIIANYGIPYKLEAYNLLGIGYYLRLPEHRFSVRVNNLLGKTYAEPGASGYDIPGLKREIVLGYSYIF